MLYLRVYFYLETLFRSINVQILLIFQKKQVNFLYSIKIMHYIKYSSYFGLRRFT